VEDLFANEAERRKWQRKTSEQRRRAARKKVSGPFYFYLHLKIMEITFWYKRKHPKYFYLKLN